MGNDFLKFAAGVTLFIVVLIVGATFADLYIFKRKLEMIKASGASITLDVNLRQKD